MEPYASLDDIRRKCARLKSQTDDVGTGDGSNKVFYTKRHILNALEVFSEDARVKTIYNVVSLRGNKVTISPAPATDAKVKVQYEFSTINDKRVSDARDKAVAWVQRCLEGIFDYKTWGKNVPSDVQTAVIYYAAGLLLSDEFGLVTEEGLPTDGNSKMKMAKMMIKDVKESLKQNQGIKTEEIYKHLHVFDE